MAYSEKVVDHYENPRNVGSFDSPVRVSDEIPAEIQLPKMIEICNRYVFSSANSRSRTYLSHSSGAL